MEQYALSRYDAYCLEQIVACLGDQGSNALDQLHSAVCLPEGCHIVPFTHAGI
jgi:hypothetical protein